jgi:hypothetical protein
MFFVRGQLSVACGFPYELLKTELINAKDGVDQLRIDKEQLTTDHGQLTTDKEQLTAFTSTK